MVVTAAGKEMRMTENKALSAIRDLIGQDKSQMREHDGYVGGGRLIHLTEKQAEIAVYLGIPVGVRCRLDDRHGSHKGEYSFYMVNNTKHFKECFKLSSMDNHASIYPYLPDPKRMLGYIEQVEGMGIPMNELILSGDYGLERLRHLASMVEYRTDYKQQFAGDCIGGVYVRQQDNAATGLMMKKKPDLENECYRLEFQGYIRKSGTYMSSGGMREIADEVKKMADLLAELERDPVIVTEEQMNQWAKEVTAMQVDRAIQEASERDPQLDPTMGMM